MLLPLLYNLRAQKLSVGIGEWLRFLDGLKLGLADDLDGVYRLGRAVLIHNEAHFDAYDIAFAATFKGLDIPDEFKKKLAEWLEAALADPKKFEGEKVGQGFGSMEELLKEYEKRLKEQKERHDGGSHWIGTGGTSPFGNSGQSQNGVRVGGKGGGGGAVAVAEERKWQGYRTDMTLDVRDFKVALRALRNFVREGSSKLDMPLTIEKTCQNAGEIELAERPERINRMRLILLMDAGGSMEPHASLVSRLFTAANELKTFKTFDAWYFHNCPYRYLYRDYATFDRKPTSEVLRDLTPEHRVVWVGDASMAPWELFSSGWGNEGPNGLENIKLFARKCPAGIWLNPDPERFWDHPTVNAIGATVKMFPLTIDGLKRGVRHLRKPVSELKAAG